MAKRFFQEGSDFYDKESGELIASYPQLVWNDWDIIGAEFARDRFLREFPEYVGGEVPPPSERGFLGQIAHEVANLPIATDESEVR